MCWILHIVKKWLLWGATDLLVTCEKLCFLKVKRKNVMVGVEQWAVVHWPLFMCQRPFPEQIAFLKEGTLGSKPTPSSWQLGAIHSYNFTLPPPLVWAVKMISHLNFGTRRDMAIFLFKSPNLGSRSIEKLKTCPGLHGSGSMGWLARPFVSHQCSSHNNRKVEEMWKRRRKIILASIAKASAKTTKLINGCFLLGPDFFIWRNIQDRRKPEEPKNILVAGAEFCIMSRVFFASHRWEEGGWRSAILGGV